ncbi:hypothetical protein, partial [Mesorhizobium japonicum]|uniref:hypothetical protein n=1 Tax=Mesorhizobium japonicum TaxID=2066070 RepID=UPI003B5A3E28
MHEHPVEAELVDLIARVAQHPHDISLERAQIPDAEGLLDAAQVEDAADAGVTLQRTWRRSDSIVDSLTNRLAASSCTSRPSGASVSREMSEASRSRGPTGARSAGSDPWPARNRAYS